MGFLSAFFHSCCMLLLFLLLCCWPLHRLCCITSYCCQLLRDCQQLLLDLG
jgi:hypothetical protein